MGPVCSGSYLKMSHVLHKLATGARDNFSQYHKLKIPATGQIYTSVKTLLKNWGVSQVEIKLIGKGL